MSDKTTSDAQFVVYVIDDDEAMRGSLESLIRSVGIQVEAFGSARFTPRAGA